MSQRYAPWRRPALSVDVAFGFGSMSRTFGGQSSGRTRAAFITHRRRACSGQQQRADAQQDDFRSYGPRLRQDGALPHRPAQLPSRRSVYRETIYSARCRATCARRVAAAALCRKKIIEDRRLERGLLKSVELSRPKYRAPNPVSERAAVTHHAPPSGVDNSPRPNVSRIRL